jgi:hypothetical protein
VAAAPCLKVAAAAALVVVAAAAPCLKVAAAVVVVVVAV